MLWIAEQHLSMMAVHHTALSLIKICQQGFAHLAEVWEPPGIASFRNRRVCTASRTMNFLGKIQINLVNMA